MGEKKCPRCGKVVHNDSGFCSFCGYSFNESFLSKYKIPIILIIIIIIIATCFLYGIANQNKEVNTVIINNTNNNTNNTNNTNETINNNDVNNENSNGPVYSKNKYKNWYPPHVNDPLSDGWNPLEHEVSREYFANGDFKVHYDDGYYRYCDPNGYVMSYGFA